MAVASILELCLKIWNLTGVVFITVDGGLSGNKIHACNSIWGTNPRVNYMYHICIFLSSLLLSCKFLYPGLFAIGQLCFLLAISAPSFCWLCLPPDWSSKLSFITGVCVRQHPWHHTGSLLPPLSGWVPGLELRFPGLHGGCLHPLSHLAQLGWVFWNQTIPTTCIEEHSLSVHILLTLEGDWILLFILDCF